MRNSGETVEAVLRCRCCLEEEDDEDSFLDEVDGDSGGLLASLPPSSGGVNVVRSMAASFTPLPL